MSIFFPLSAHAVTFTDIGCDEIADSTYEISGGNYQLNTDFAVCETTANPAIRIKNTNSTTFFKCQNVKIKGLGSGTAIEIENATTTLVYDCRIEGFERGIDARNSSELSFFNNEIDAENWGIYVENSSLIGEGIHRNFIRAGSNSTGGGIVLNDVSNPSILMNFIKAGKEGIKLWTGDDTLTDPVEISENYITGAQAGGASDEVGGAGIDISYSGNELQTAVKIHDNVLYANRVGIRFSPTLSTDAILQNLEIYQNIIDNYGLNYSKNIEFFGTISPTKFHNNAFVGAEYVFGRYPFLSPAYIDTVHSVIYNNYFEVESYLPLFEDGVENSQIYGYWSKIDPPQEYNLVREPYKGGNYWSNYSSTCIPDDSAPYYGSFCELPEGEYYNPATNVYDVYPLAHALPTQAPTPKFQVWDPSAEDWKPPSGNQPYGLEIDVFDTVKFQIRGTDPDSFLNISDMDNANSFHDAKCYINFDTGGSGKSNISRTVPYFDSKKNPINDWLETSHTYTEPGTYETEVVCFDGGAGFSNGTSKKITITVTAPEPPPPPPNEYTASVTGPSGVRSWAPAVFDVECTGSALNRCEVVFPSGVIVAESDDYTIHNQNMARSYNESNGSISFTVEDVRFYASGGPLPVVSVTATAYSALGEEAKGVELVAINSATIPGCGLQATLNNEIASGYAPYLYDFGGSKITAEVPVKGFLTVWEGAVKKTLPDDSYGGFEQPYTKEIVNTQDPDDDGIFEYTIDTLEHEYTEEGIYTATLEAEPVYETEDYCGQANPDTMEIDVSGPPSQGITSLNAEYIKEDGEVELSIQCDEPFAVLKFTRQETGEVVTPGPSLNIPCNSSRRYNSVFTGPYIYKVTATAGAHTQFTETAFFAVGKELSTLSIPDIHPIFALVVALGVLFIIARK